MTTKYTKRINEIYPDLQIEKAVIDETGQNNDVLIINDSLVFRFPKYKKGIDDLLREVKLLNTLQPFTTLPIPNHIYSCFTELEIGKVFTGYEKINGASLSRTAFREIKNLTIQENLAHQLVTFLKEVHSTPIKQLELEKLDVYNTFHDLYTTIQTKLFPYMREDAKKQITETFQSFLQDTTFQELNLTLIHGDFGASNILWNPDSGTITGIIDFGGSCIGDPAYDFAGLLSSYGEDFFRTCISVYPNGEKVAKRVMFYRSTFALQEALHGIKNNDPTAFKNGMRDYI